MKDPLVEQLKMEEEKRKMEGRKQSGCIDLRIVSHTGISLASFVARGFQSLGLVTKHQEHPPNS
jgi:hypothetical protein